MTWISEHLTSNGSSKCRSLQAIVFYQVGYDRDASDIR